jgi:hypothetical protein
MLTAIAFHAPCGTEGLGELDARMDIVCTVRRTWVVVNAAPIHDPRALWCVDRFGVVRVAHDGPGCGAVSVLVGGVRCVLPARGRAA